MIFSKSYCPYCKATKELLTEILQQEKFSKVRMDVVELDKFPDPETGAEIQAYLEKRTGQRTVPNVFIDKQHVGGNSDVQAKHQEGGLEPWILSSLDDDFEDAVEL
jgi:glutaredoxin 3